jgi:thioredoxin-like negative regulator of GroEL
MMIDFTRDFCLPCQIMEPSVAALRREHAGTVDILEVNVDREGNERFGLFFVVDSVPTQVFVEASGRIAARHEGIATQAEMHRTFQSLGWIP